MRRPWLPRDMREPPALPTTTSPPTVRRRLAHLVQPFYAKDPHGSFGKHVLTPSTALTSLAAVTPPSWKLVHWDENLLQGPPPADPVPELVGITVHLTFARRAYELAAWYRRRGAKVVLGGPHVAACPDEAAAHADAVAIGSGVAVWPRILRDVEEGRLRQVYRGSYEGSFADEPPPRRDILPAESFLTTLSVIATRGCRHRCEFCFLSTEGLRMPRRSRRVPDVLDEIARARPKYAVFIDNNLGANPDWLRHLCVGLRTLEVTWSAAVTIEVTDDPRLVRAMARSGCTGVFVGLETLDATNLRSSRKGGPTPDEYARRIRVFHDHGIQVNGSFVFGFDRDDAGVFDRTVDWIEENRLECATFHILTPYPGTPLFRRLEAEGRILHRSWDLYDTAHAVFRPRRMSPETLERGYARAYERLFSLGSIWRRRPEDVRAVLPYLAMSILYKRSNRLWRALIRHRLTAAAWGPLVEITRRRHLAVRKRRERQRRPARDERRTEPASVLRSLPGVVNPKPVGLRCAGTTVAKAGGACHRTTTRGPSRGRSRGSSGTCARAATAPSTTSSTPSMPSSGASRAGTWPVRLWEAPRDGGR
jgi:radical SAM superfamily enzyme YgiQ (UPF0313 family)